MTRRLYVLKNKYWIFLFDCGKGKMGSGGEGTIEETIVNNNILQTSSE